VVLLIKLLTCVNPLVLSEAVVMLVLDTRALTVAVLPI